MVLAYFLSVILAMEVIVSGYRFGAAGGLNMNYYIMTCPFAEAVVKDIVDRALQDDPTMAAGLIRMHFHDCFIEVYINTCIIYMYNYIRVLVLIFFVIYCTCVGL